MKKYWFQVVCAVFLGVVLPWSTIRLASLFLLEEDALHPTQPDQVQKETSSTIAVIHDGTPEIMELDEYLVGVLLCEMPDSFHEEAKKAQAVVARTYALRTVSIKQKHTADAICTDSACCQGYLSPQEYLERGGTQEAVEAARSAVQQTRALVLEYAGELIDATYFSTSGGTTEAAVAVWGADVPYLQSVSSPGEEIAVHYTDTVTFTTEEFQKCLGVSLSGQPHTWFGKVTYTDGGGVDVMVIGGEAYRGTDLRRLLGLRSTALTVTAVGSSVIITTKGFGHRVGMSQYGAQAMALRGSSYEQILQHYYQDTQLTPMTQ